MLTIIKKKSVFWDLIGSILLGFFIIGIISYFTTNTALAWWLNTDYAYRQSITITNAAGGSAQTNYQVQVSVDTYTLIQAGKLKADCSDIKFGNSTDTNLTFWRESACSNTSGVNTLYWITVPTIAIGSSTATIYVYYGYADGTDASSYTSLPTGISVGTGADGACTVSSPITLDGASNNTCIARAQADGVSFASTANNTSGQNQVTTSTTPTGLVVGDEILIINLQGTSGDNSNVGKYETARITGISTNTLTLNHNLTNTYNGTGGTQKIVIQRVPNYTNVTINSGGTITATAFNGTKGGIIFFRASGTLTVSSGGTVEASSLGFRSTAGGAAATVGTQETFTGTVNSSSTAGSLGSNGTNEGGAGGGGSGSGGGGGGYSGTGGTGTSGSAGGRGACAGNDGYDNCTGAGGNGASGGTAAAGNTNYGAAALTTIYLGSSGFSGSGGGNGGNGGSGGVGAGGAGGASGIGGGIVIIGASTITIAGNVKANGGNGSAGSVGTANQGGIYGNSAPGGGGGGGGGGSGGSILINSASTTFGSSLISSTAGTAGAGGGGGSATYRGGGGGGNPGGNGGPNCPAPTLYCASSGTSANNAGGVGTTGRIAANYSTTSGSSNPTANNTVLPIASAPNGDEEGAPDPTPTPTPTPTSTIVDVRIKSNIRVKSNVRVGQ
ncbi:MAG: DUF2341 domain-containing protein [Candidatus Daviesbacteria bacterium]|nr:DUF2341 domain-containing protein [Candidatus Daviesbacteria bacterium]